MTTKEQKKLQKRKAREDQNRKNLLRRQFIAQKIKKEERVKSLALRAEEKAENRANNNAMKAIKEQKALESEMAEGSSKFLAVSEKINEAKAAYEKVKSKLTPEQTEQILKNIAILEELKDEYNESVEHRSQINQELEDKGMVSMKDKMQYLADQAREEFGEGCIDQVVCESE